MYHFDRLEESAENIDAKAIVKEQLQEVHSTSGYTFNAPMSTLQGLANSLKELQQLLAPAPVKAAVPLDVTAEEQQATEDLQQLQDVMADPEIADDIAALKQLASEAEALVNDLKKKEQLKQTAASDDTTPKVGAAEANQAGALYGHLESLAEPTLPGQGTANGGAKKNAFAALSEPKNEKNQAPAKTGLTFESLGNFTKDSAHAALVELTAISKKLEAYIAKHPKSAQAATYVMQFAGAVATAYAYVQAAGAGMAMGGAAGSVIPGLGTAAGAVIGGAASVYAMMKVNEAVAHNIEVGVEKVQQQAANQGTTSAESQEFYDTAGNALKMALLAATLFGLKKVVSPSKSVWSKGPTVRGEEIEKMLGQNLHQNFPVVDRFKDGVATSIKSLDLHAPTYQNLTKLDYKVRKYIDKVANFNGGNVGELDVIKFNQIKARGLDLAIPKGGSTAQQQILQQMKEYANLKNVVMNIITIK